MSFKWDWDKKELVEGESPEKDFSILEAPVILGGLGLIMYVFIQYVAPWLGHLLLGGFL